MQFNSFLFILLFLPLFIALYFICNRINSKLGPLLIIVSGLVFYYFAGKDSFVLLLISCAVNYLFALLISRMTKGKKTALIIAVSVNAGLLLFYKYIHIILGYIPNDVLSKAFVKVPEFAFPLGISFFTFQQIMYVVNVYKGKISKADITDYLAYIMYFPKLIMGPLAEPSDLIAQINDLSKRRINIDNITTGIKLFSFGLFKKLVLAETFKAAADWGFTNPDIATSMDLILVMLFYTFEIYFDFSGYSDMAVGVSKMINIDLPLNFDSPYKAVSVRDFWRRWHVSLTGFFTEYIYFPLGGSRKGRIRTYINIMTVFLISGIWHGSGLVFILWGAIHGILQVLERLLDKVFIKIPKVIRWIYTFVSVNFLWLLFNSGSVRQWYAIVLKMIRFEDLTISKALLKSFRLPETSMLLDVFNINLPKNQNDLLILVLFTLAAFVICLIPKNNYRNQDKKTVLNMILAGLCLVWAVLCINASAVFIYQGF